MLGVMAVLGSTLSFLTDQVTFVIGTARAKYAGVGYGSLLVVMTFNVTCAVLARFIIRSAKDAEGSGFPEMKAIIFGKVGTNFLTLRTLFAKASALTLVVAAGLPIGKEGNNVQMAACIGRLMNPSLFEDGPQPKHLAQAAKKLLLAACAVGVGATFSGPIGGVCLALELVLPQTFDKDAYWGCFAAGIIGSLTFSFQRTWTAQATGLLPLISTNVSAGEGDTSTFPITRLMLDVMLGLICGALAGLWIQCHTVINTTLKKWRIQSFAPPSAQNNDLLEPLLTSDSQTLKIRMKEKLWRWTLRIFHDDDGNVLYRDVLLVAAVTAANTVVMMSMPLFGGRPQPTLTSVLFDKTLLDNADAWMLPFTNPLGTMIIGLLMKWLFSCLALSLPTPTGVVAPAIILGGLIGRIYAMCLPAWWIESLITVSPGSSLTLQDHYGAFVARSSIIGATAFVAGITRAFTMCVTIFEVLALPNSVLPLCSSTMASIFVANKIALPFFDANLFARGMGGISAITSLDHHMTSVTKVMEPIHSGSCITQLTNARQLRNLLQTCAAHYFPIVRLIELTGLESDGRGDMMLVGGMSRVNMEKLLRLIEQGNSPTALSPHPLHATPLHGMESLEDAPLDMLDPELQVPAVGDDRDQRHSALVDGTPLCINTYTTCKEAYLLLRQANVHHVWVVDSGRLQGALTLEGLIKPRV